MSNARRYRDRFGNTWTDKGDGLLYLTDTARPDLFPHGHAFPKAAIGFSCGPFTRTTETPDE